MTSALPPKPVNAPVSAPISAAAERPAQTMRIDSQQLFAGAHEVQIHHHGAVYRLKQTALGKLILTK